MASHPTSKKRNQAKKARVRYSKKREDAQLSGAIPTTPEGAVRDERVDPRSQGEQKIPSLDRRAIKESWEVPPAVKAKVIERLAEPFFEQDVIIDKDGNAVPVPPDRRLLTENAKVLLMADQRQWERDNPETAGKARGGGTINNNQQVAVVDWSKMSAPPQRQDPIEARLAEVESLPPKEDRRVQEPSANGHSNNGDH